MTTSLTSKAQIVKIGELVQMPVNTYRAMRTAILTCDTLKQSFEGMNKDCDSIVALQDKRLSTKDSIILNLNTKIEYKDSIIVILKDNKPTQKVHPQFWIGSVIGIILTVLLLR